ncbi:hypothetical protein LZZ85_00775 [Terrimonas sp. NA20]|uniref:DUF4262 domain-containing protein n=1 Tax=Terrimonas ginsenosidimutans TaxID=2908004 RepID=A0ABS9KKF9_9BACT|nr:hypothetical protein [Terrimonas ginsenosidimutans]MCG2612784.1 hypothetical protein [Terrimonas ginsenosidimutans]
MNFLYNIELMNTLHIQQKLKELQRTVNSFGYNYEITLGFDEFLHCTMGEGVFTKLKGTYPAIDIPQLHFLPVTEMEFWKTIDETLRAEGDLKPRGLEKIRLLVSDLTQTMGALIPPASKFYYSDLPNGIPGYPVWWDFSFVIETTSGVCFFMYGSASD